MRARSAAPLLTGTLRLSSQRQPSLFASTVLFPVTQLCARSLASLSSTSLIRSVFWTYGVGAHGCAGLSGVGSFQCPPACALAYGEHPYSTGTDPLTLFSTHLFAAWPRFATTILSTFSPSQCALLLFLKFSYCEAATG